MSSFKCVLLATAGFILAACGRQTHDTAATSVSNLPTIQSVSSADILNAENTPEVWLSYGGTYEEQRHSKLDQITAVNIGRLKPAWTYDFDKAKTARGVEATPIVLDGIMYVTGAWSMVYALDAKTGEELWVYDPEVSGEDAAKGCCDVVNRGVAVHEGKVLVAVFDGRLEALDAKTGEVVWSTLTVDKSMPYTMTGAPRVVKDKVLIGNGGAELGVRGYVSAYNVNTGKLDWRFYTAPNPNKEPDGAASDKIFADLANDSWGDDGAWTTDGGGGTVWDSIVYDDVNDQIVIGVGNASPWNADIRDPNSDGDNLFLSSIVALDADSGEYKWHFQTTPRDQWDYTATQSIILAELPVGDGGASKRVVMQAPKNGFFYVLDAETGTFISGNNFTPVQTWASGLDENGRPIVVPAARDSANIFLMIPGPLGAHNWHPMAYNPDTKLAYIPAQVAPQYLVNESEKSTKNNRWNIGYDLAAGVPPTFTKEQYAELKASVTGSLIAWDPVKQEARWTVNYEEGGNGGVMSTASGLVFHGTPKGDFLAYDAASGDKLWSYKVNNGVAAAPSTFELEGEQYIALATGWGGAWALSNGHAWGDKAVPNLGRVVVFKLDGKAKIPNLLDAWVPKTPKAESFGTAEQVSLGLQRYSDNCMVCHGPLVMSSGVLPDLRWSDMSANPDAWNDIVMEGSLSDTGMVSFKDQLSNADSEAIRAYVLDQAWLAVKNGEATAGGE